MQHHGKKPFYSQTLFGSFAEEDSQVQAKNILQPFAVKEKNVSLLTGFISKIESNESEYISKVHHWSNWELYSLS